MFSPGLSRDSPALSWAARAASFLKRESIWSSVSAALTAKRAPRWGRAGGGRRWSTSALRENEGDVELQEIADLVFDGAEALGPVLAEVFDLVGDFLIGGKWGSPAGRGITVFGSGRRSGG